MLLYGVLPMRSCHTFWIACFSLVSFFWKSGNVFLVEASRNPSQQIDPVLALLPWTPRDVPGQRVTFSLHAYGGCYIWSSQRPDLVEVTGVPKGNKACAEDAVVVPTSATPYGGRVWVFARDQESDVELRCEVHVAPIARISIDTPARSIGVDTVETVTIRATDGHGNVFSSLEGLWFLWESSDLGVLSFASLDSDIYRASPRRQEIQKNGGQTDLVLLKGVSSGRSRINARLVSQGYRNVPLAEVTLDVSEPLFIEPPFLRTIPFARLEYRLRVLKPQRSTAESPLILLPSPHFAWFGKSMTTKPARLPVDVHPTLGTVFINDTLEAQTVIVVRDLRIANNTAESVLVVSKLHYFSVFFTSSVSNFVSPEQLDQWEAAQLLSNVLTSRARLLKTLRFQPVWYLVKSRVYLMGVDGMNEREEDLYLPPSLDVRLSCLPYNGTKNFQRLKLGTVNNCHCLELKRLSATSRFLLFKASSLGFGRFRYEIPKTEGLQPNAALIESLFVEQAYRVTEPVSVKYVINSRQPLMADYQEMPNLLVLPPYSLWTFEAEGGSGSYKWVLSNASVARIEGDESALGTIMTNAALGYCFVTVSDKHDKTNYFNFTVIVTSVKSITLDPPYRQIVSGSPVAIPLRVLPAPLVCLEDCPNVVKRWNDDVTRLQVDGKGMVFSEQKNARRHLTPSEFVSTHFLNCSDLETSSQKIMRTQAVIDGNRETTTYLKASTEPFVCAYMTFTAPTAPSLVKLVAQLGTVSEANRMVQIFSPLATALVGIEDTPWKTTFLRKPLDKSMAHYTMSVGSWLELEILGGPIDHNKYNILTQVIGAENLNHLHVHINLPNRIARFTCLDTLGEGESTQVHFVRRGVPLAVDPLKLSSLTPFNFTSSLKSASPHLPYSEAAVETHTTVTITCVYPSYVVLLPYHPRDISVREWKSRSELTQRKEGQGNDTVASAYIHCDEEHRLGLFVYSAKRELIQFWSTAYTTLWFAERLKLQRITSALYSTKVLPEECYGTVEVQVTFRLDVQDWQERLGQLGSNKTAAENLLHRLIAYRSGTRRNRRELKLLDLRDNMVLIPVPPLDIIPSRSVSALKIYPFYYLPRWARRIHIRFGSGVYRVHLKESSAIDVVPGKAILGSVNVSVDSCLQLQRGLSIHDSATTIAPSAEGKVPVKSAHDGLQMTYLYSGDYLQYSGRARKGLEGCVDLVKTTPGILARLPIGANASFAEATTNLARLLLDAPGVYRSRQSYWDIFLIPRRLASSAFTLIVEDQRVVGAATFEQQYVFAPLGRLHLKFESDMFRLPLEYNGLPYETVTLQRPQNDTLFVDVHDVVKLGLEAFDDFYKQRFDTEEMRLMKLCLTVINQENGASVRASCITPREDYDGNGAATQDVLEGPRDELLWKTVIALNRQAAQRENVKLRDQNAFNDISAADGISSATLFFQALEKGSYTLQAVGHNSEGPRIKSNILRVVVSDPLALRPSRVVMLPGDHTFELSLLGVRDALSEEFRSSQSFTIETLREDHEEKKAIALQVVTVELVANNSFSPIVNQPAAFIRVTTGRECGSVTVVVTENDFSRSEIARRAVAHIIVQQPKYLRIAPYETIKNDTRGVDVITLRQLNAQGLKALLYTENNTPFSLFQHWMPVGKIASEHMENTSLMHTLDVCECEWTTDRPDYIVFIEQNEKIGYEEEWRMSQKRYLNVAKEQLSGIGLFTVQIVAIGSSKNEPLESTVRVHCLCGEARRSKVTIPTTAESLARGNQKLSLPVLNCELKAQLRVRIVPNPLLLEEPLFLPRYAGVAPKALLPTNDIWERWTYRPQLLHLASYGLYTFRVPKMYSACYVSVTPPSPKPLLSVKLNFETSTVKLVVHVDTSGKHDVLLHFATNELFGQERLTIPVRVALPFSLTASPLASRVHIGSYFVVTPVLRDEFGYPLSFPNNYRLSAYPSHGSLVRTKVVNSMSSERQDSASFLTAPFTNNGIALAHPSRIARPYVRGYTSQQRGCSSVELDVRGDEDVQSVMHRVFRTAIRLCVDAAVYPNVASLVSGGSVHVMLLEPKKVAAPLSVGAVQEHTISLRVLLKPSSVLWALESLSPSFSCSEALSAWKAQISCKTLLSWLEEQRQPFLAVPRSCLNNKTWMVQEIEEKIKAGVEALITQSVYDVLASEGLISVIYVNGSITKVGTATLLEESASDDSQGRKWAPSCGETVLYEYAFVMQMGFKNVPLLSPLSSKQAPRLHNGPWMASTLSKLHMRIALKSLAEAAEEGLGRHIAWFFGGVRLGPTNDALGLTDWIVTDSFEEEEEKETLVPTKVNMSRLERDVMLLEGEGSFRVMITLNEEPLASMSVNLFSRITGAFASLLDLPLPWSASSISSFPITVAVQHGTARDKERGLSPATGKKDCKLCEQYVVTVPKARSSIHLTSTSSQNSLLVFFLPYHIRDGASADEMGPQYEWLVSTAFVTQRIDAQCNIRESKQLSLLFDVTLVGAIPVTVAGTVGTTVGCQLVFKHEQATLQQLSSLPSDLVLEAAFRGGGVSGTNWIVEQYRWRLELGVVPDGKNPLLVKQCTGDKTRQDDSGAACKPANAIRLSEDTVFPVFLRVFTGGHCNLEAALHNAGELRVELHRVTRNITELRFDQTFEEQRSDKGTKLSRLWANVYPKKSSSQFTTVSFDRAYGVSLPEGIGSSLNLRCGSEQLSVPIVTVKKDSAGQQWDNRRFNALLLTFVWNQLKNAVVSIGHLHQFFMVEMLGVVAASTILAIVGVISYCYLDGRRRQQYYHKTANLNILEQQQQRLMQHHRRRSSLSPLSSLRRFEGTPLLGIGGYTGQSSSSPYSVKPFRVP